MKYAIFQPQRDRNIQPNTEEFDTYYEATNFPTPEAIDKAVLAGIYANVGFVEAENLDQVYQIGNLGPEDNIIRVDWVNMRSISVGDVIVPCTAKTTHVHYVDRFGFTELDEKLSGIFLAAAFRMKRFWE